MFVIVASLLLSTQEMFQSLHMACDEYILMTCTNGLEKFLIKAMICRIEVIISQVILNDTAILSAVCRHIHTCCAHTHTCLTILLVTKLTIKYPSLHIHFICFGKYYITALWWHNTINVLFCLKHQVQNLQSTETFLLQFLWQIVFIKTPKPLVFKQNYMFQLLKRLGNLKCWVFNYHVIQLRLCYTCTHTHIHTQARVCALYQRLPVSISKS